jgi:REP element-mobilizing transposase RayT
MATDSPGQPLAYFITFRTYGTWLHGDERGSMQRGSSGLLAPPIPQNPLREAWEARQLLHPPVLLNAHARSVVDAAIRETCLLRDWPLSALNVRTNHVHMVVSAPIAPERVLNSLKAWCTQRLKEAGLAVEGGRAWSRHGSTRYLWREADVAAACEYVEEAQGPDI